MTRPRIPHSLLRTLLLLGLVSVTADAALAGPDKGATPYLDVVILAGQSNMVGGALVQELPPHQLEFANTVPGLRHRLWLNGYFAGDEWSDLHPRSGTLIGPEMMFGHVLGRHRQVDEIALFKMAYNGTSLHCDWSVDGCGRYLASRIPSVISTVRAELGQQDRIVRFAGLIWVQGEADCSAQWAADAYAENFRSLLEYFRSVTNNPQLPAVIARVSPESPDYTHVSELHASMMEIARTDPLVTTVTCEDLALKEDQVHMTAEGFIGLGARLADTFLTLRTFELLENLESACIGDVDWDALVGSSDLGLLMSQWQSSGGETVNCDLNNDQIVNGLDLALMLTNWGDC